ncbi:MAG: maltotransferase domain-containing protein, partial [Pseudomonas putida]
MSRNEPFESVPMANDHPEQAISLSQALLAPRIVIEDTEPVLEAGTFAAKATSGQPVAVSSKVYSDGHDRLAVMLNWRQAQSRRWHCVPMQSAGNDLWLAEFTPTELGPHLFSIEAWVDPFATYSHDLEKKYNAGVEVKLELEEGRLMLGKGIELCSGAVRDELEALQQRLAELDTDGQVTLLLGPDVAHLMSEAGHRSYLARSREFPVDVDRPAAQFASWYELFPRSITDDPQRHGTFNDVHQRLPMIRDMGFDVLYFPPIHPIGTQHRKGRNNALKAEPGDPGSPYAIGSAEGGHDAIHPQLGTREDFRRLVAAAAEHGLEIALDFAIQCSQDHPWLKEHPGWFSWRPDGTIRYAENPPKKYQDIVNVDFYAPDAVPSLWLALRDVVLGWVEEGVKTFRVDNPHTKPLPF